MWQEMPRSIEVFWFSKIFFCFFWLVVFFSDACGGSQISKPMDLWIGFTQRRLTAILFQQNFTRYCCNIRQITGWWFQTFFIFTPKIGDMIQFDLYFFRWVGSTTNQIRNTFFTQNVWTRLSPGFLVAIWLLQLRSSLWYLTMGCMSLDVRSLWGKISGEFLET